MRGKCKNCKKESVLKARGLCENCYQKLIKLPNFDELYPSTKKSRLKQCKVEGCENNARAKGYCQRHYGQIYLTGNLLDNNPKRTVFDKNEIVINKNLNCAEVIIYNNKGYEKCRALIDIEDIDKVKDIKWSGDKYIYSGDYRLHRYIMNCTDDNLVVDHINRNSLDNRKENLRICTPIDNSRNKGLFSFNTSGFTGVSFNKNINKWTSIITFENKNITLGFFDSKEEALKERLKAEVYYFGEFAPQKHLFDEYGIDINETYEVKKYTPRKKGNSLGIKGIFKGSGNYKDKWKVEFTCKGNKIYLGYYNTLEEAIKAKEDYIKLN